MPAMGTIEMTGQDKLRSVVSEFKRRGADPTPWFEDVGQYMKAIVVRAQREQQDPETGEHWPHLAAITYASRAASGYMTADSPLYSTGRLIRSYIASAPEVNKFSVSIGTSLPYALAHHLGMVLRPKSAKNLAIPLSREAARAGSARRWVEQMKQGGYSIHTMTSKAGHKFLGAIAGARTIRLSDVTGAQHTRKSTGRPMPVVPGAQLGFLLVPSVTIPKRRVAGFGQRDRDHIAKIGLDYLAEAVRHAG